MFSLACADYTFPLLTRRQALGVIALLDFQAVDIGLFRRSEHYSPGGLVDDPAQFTRQVRQELDEFGLRASDVFLQIGMEPAESAANSPDPEVRARNREVFLHTVEFCAEIGCRHLTGLPGVKGVPGVSGVPHWGDRAEDVWRAADEAAWRVDNAAAAGLRYAIEPHIGSICEDPVATAKLLEAAPGLTLTLDYGHFIALGHTNENVHPLIPFASHVHIRGGAPGKLQAGLDENTIDFPFLLQRLQQVEYRGDICCEYVWVDWMGCNRTDNLSETVLLRDLVRRTRP